MERTVQWNRFELLFEGPSGGNPFLEVDLQVDAVLGNRTVTVRGFYDGEGRYRARIMADAPGVWCYRTRSSAPALHGVTGEFEVVPPSARAVAVGATTVADGRVAAADARSGDTAPGGREAPNHGPVEVVGTRFSYADGTPYVPVGTTCYAWLHQPREIRDRTIGTLANAPFTKIRMCLFPKHYRYNHNEPDRFVFPGSLSDGFDLERFDPAFFAELEFELDRLQALGIEADLILFHPYDRWGFQELPAEVEERYLRYTIARLASFRNVWWSMANEWDLFKVKTVQDFHRYFRTVQAEDPYAHLRSVHNCRPFYDHALPWVTHASVQHSDTARTDEWRRQYGKPIVIDECCYEGDIPEGWGCITGRELVARQWRAVIRGGWPGAHGETYYNDDEVLWWSKGGTLTGDAPERIAFMRRILEEAPLERLAPSDSKWSPHLATPEGDYILHYLDVSRPSWREYALPEGRSYRVDVIDTWEMTVTTLDAPVSGTARVSLPAKEHQAIRFRARTD